MPNTPRIVEPVYRAEDHELMGNIVNAADDLWVPSTIFGYPLAEPMPKGDAVRFLQNNGLQLLISGWELKDDDEWYKCEIIESKPDVITVKITDFGHPNAHNTVTIQNPNEHSIRRR